MIRHFMINGFKNMINCITDSLNGTIGRVQKEKYMVASKKRKKISMSKKFKRSLINNIS